MNPNHRKNDNLDTLQRHFDLNPQKILEILNIHKNCNAINKTLTILKKSLKIPFKPSKKPDNPTYHSHLTILYSI